jgi:hypothetical protein
MMDFGYRALILGDPKDEYERLCTLLGVEPSASAPACPPGSTPWRSGPLAAGWAHLDRPRKHARAAIVFGRWLTLMRALVGSQRIGADPGAVRARGGDRRQGRPARPHRVHRRPPTWSRPPSPPCGTS